MSRASRRYGLVVVALCGLATLCVVIVRARSLDLPARSASEAAPARATASLDATSRTTTGPSQPSFSMSPYQAQVASATLVVLDDMEGAARHRGDTVLLARLKDERTRVLRAATRLPTTAPARHERNEP